MEMDGVSTTGLPHLLGGDSDNTQQKIGTPNNDNFRQTERTHVRSTNDGRRDADAGGSVVPDMVTYPGASPSRQPATQGN